MIVLLVPLTAPDQFTDKEPGVITEAEDDETTEGGVQLEYRSGREELLYPLSTA